jgi:hypothetical protein
MKLSRLPLTTLAALAAAIVPFAAIPAHAQKPALTENIDERGRVPYHSDSYCNPLGGNSCNLTFKSVPAGNRLVVTHASVRFFAQPPSNTSVGTCAILTGGTPSPGESLYEEPLAAANEGPLSSGQVFYVVSSPVTYYLEPLGTPSISVLNALSNFGVDGSISGYLVSIP